MNLNLTSIEEHKIVEICNGPLDGVFAALETLNEALYQLTNPMPAESPEVDAVYVALTTLENSLSETVTCSLRDVLYELEKAGFTITRKETP